jgi:hypothetical protein
MIRSLAALILLAAHARTASAADVDQDFEARAAAVDEACARAGKPEFPAADRPTEAEARAVAATDCDPEALYYGIGAPADPVAARRCAFVRLSGVGDASAGAAVLMMIYANGRGAARDLGIAIALACADREGVAQAERVGRIDHLLAMKAGDEAGAFDLCDDITSGRMMGYCASLQERRETGARDARLAAIAARVPGRAKGALARLDAAAKAFFDARVEHEVDLSGTARAALQIEERTRLRDGFLASLEALLAAPPAWADRDRDFEKADRALNAAYRAALAAEPGSRGTVTADGTRATQRLWIPYRDAWTAFGTALYPNVSAPAWKAWVTRARTEMLAQ